MICADDTVIFCCGNSARVNENPIKLACWFSCNFLTLNFTKSTFMMFGTNLSSGFRDVCKIMLYMKENQLEKV